MNKEPARDKNPLAQNIQELTKQMRSSNSYWKYLGRGVLFGIGSAIGASFIAAILVGIILRILHSLKDVPGIFR